jgi:hypothetical protein
MRACIYAVYVALALDIVHVYCETVHTPIPSAILSILVSFCLCLFWSVKYISLWLVPPLLFFWGGGGKLGFINQTNKN